MEKIYPSKILLAGEYTILMGSGALAIPFRSKFLSWKLSEDQKNQDLFALLNYLTNNNTLKDHFHLQLFEQELHEGWYLQSNIPQGYGMGSSGAVCAAVYDRYRSDKNKPQEDVHEIFKAMEAYFHGQSSGIDPMVSYYNKPVYVESGSTKILDHFEMNRIAEFNLVLMDSGMQRSTRDLVDWFKNQLVSPEYEQSILHLSKCNQLLIQAMLQGDQKLFSTSWKDISRQSITAFSHMIPQNMMDFLKQGLKDESYYGKLCGAGGGGYFLIHFLDRTKMEQACEMHRFELIDMEFH